MYFLASKIFGVFVVPSNFVMALLICGLLLWRTRFSKSGKRLVIASIVLLMIGGITPIGTALLLPLENRFPAWDASHGLPTGIIVLGGVINPTISIQRGNISIGEDSERIVAAVELYRRYPNIHIVFSGGSADVVLSGTSESEFAGKFLEQFGIPQAHVDLERRSRNTRENAVNSMKLIKPKPGERWLLITSAYHMPRAIGLFRKVGFLVEAYPVAWRTGSWGNLMEPSFSFMGGFKHLDLAVHEWAGLIFNRLSGRTSVLFPAP